MRGQRARIWPMMRAISSTSPALMAAAGESNTAIAARLGVTRMTVTTWRNRFAKRRLPGLSDEPRPGAPRKIGDGKIADVVTATLESTPPGATHWSRRSMARASGLSVTTVHRIWSAFSLQPHRSETFKLSTDPLFVEKIVSVRSAAPCSALPGPGQKWHGKPRGYS